MNKSIENYKSPKSDYVAPSASYSHPLHDAQENQDVSILGLSSSTGKEILIKSEVRSLHTHVIGGIGSGKSRFLTGQIMQDILADRGVCLIDPHGPIYKHILNWLVANPEIMNNRTIHLLDVDNLNGCMGINPLACNSRYEIPKRAEETALLIARSVEGENLEAMPRLASTLRLAFMLLAEFGLSLCDADLIIYKKHRKLLTNMVHVMQDIYTQDAWEDLLQLPKRLWTEEWEPARRRFIDFTTNPIIRGMFSQTKNTFDFKTAMDEGQIVLVNLQERSASNQAVRLTGHMFIDMAFRAAKDRENITDARPWYVYIDECHKFLNDNIAKTIAEGRKMGLHLTLAHQWLSQLTKIDDEVFEAVYGSAHNKIIMASLKPDDAEMMARRVLFDKVRAGKINHDFDRATPTGKYEIGLTKSKNEQRGVNSETNSSSTKTGGTTDTTATTEIEGSSDGFVEVEQEAEGEGTGENEGTMSGVVTNIGSDLMSAPLGFGASQILSQSLHEASSSGTNKNKTKSTATSRSTISSSFSAIANGNSYAISEGWSTQSGKSNGTNYSSGESVNENLIMKYEIMPTATFSLDEQWHEISRSITNLRKASALVSSGNSKEVALVDCLYVPDQEQIDSLTDLVVKNLFISSQAHKSLEQVEQEFVDRRREHFKKMGISDYDEEEGWER